MATSLDPNVRTRTTDPRREVVSGVSCGTLGELFQGPHWEKSEPQISIISLPVDKYSWCYFIREPGAYPEIAGALVDRSKSNLAVKLFLDRFGKSLPPGRWEFHSELPVGKGMASSTADIVAAIRCLFNIFGMTYDQRTVIEILRSIERSDTVFLDEFALYLSQQHRIVQTFGDSIGFFTCYVVEEPSVATEDLTHQLLDHYRRNARGYRRCLADIVAAFDNADVRGVARCATMSAELSQGVVAKASFADVVDNQRAFRADGIFVAHTGSVIGYLFRQKLEPSTMDDLSAFFHGLGRQCYFAKGGWGNA
jgi:uncharacterized protein involved in propanediol utilization